MSQSPGPGIIYTETMIHSAPEPLMGEAPYQIAIVELAGGGRLTGRITGEAVRIGDRVEFVESRDNVPFFRKAFL